MSDYYYGQDGYVRFSIVVETEYSGNVCVNVSMCSTWVGTMALGGVW